LLEVTVMMARSLASLFVSVFLAAPALLAAQTYSPLVAMKVTAPDGQTTDLTARDSAVATLTLKDGTVYEVRPTVHDEPFSKVTVTIFKAATSTEATSVIGEAQVTRGGPAVEVKGKPAFKVAVVKIDPVAPPSKSS
jgi:hypothetical protein